MAKLTVKTLEDAIKKAYKYYPRCQVSHVVDKFKKESVCMYVDTTLDGKEYGRLEVDARIDGRVIISFTKPKSCYKTGAYGIKTFGPCDPNTFHNKHQLGRYFTKTSYKYVHENFISDAEDLRSLLFLYSQVVLTGTDSL